MGAVNLTRRHFALGAAALAATPVFARAAPLATGIDRLVRDPALAGGGRAIAMLTHAGAVDQRGRRAVDGAAEVLGSRLVALLSPEHGLTGHAGAGEAVDDARDAATGLPVLSLYGARRAPPDELLARIDTLLIDLQDIGLRPFTYAATMIDALRTAAAKGVRVVVLDRPNPLGGLAIDGPRPDPALISHVGALPLAFRHGMTLGEIARMIATREGLPATEVVACTGWSRSEGTRIFAPGRLPFVPPSPNLRRARAVLAYAATVLIEGTNLSEGRGTARPFETIGAPWCDGAALARAMNALHLPAVHFAPTRFTPTASKHAGQPCGGIRFTARDEPAYDPLLTGLSLIAAIRDLHAADFAFLPGERPFFDLLTGQTWIREALLAGEDPHAIKRRWQGDVDEFAAERRESLLY